MTFINLDLASFNVIKYTIITICLTPFAELLLHLVVITISKKNLVLHGSVHVGRTRCGIWGLHSHRLGRSWWGRSIVIIPAVWIITSELLIEFSFDSSSRSRFKRQTVYSTGVIPPWSSIDFSQASGDWITEESNYFTSAEIDFAILVDGTFVCQKPQFRQELVDKLLTIKQTSRWRRTFRKTDDDTVQCGSFSDVEVTAKLTVGYSESGAPVQGVDFMSNSSTAAAPAHIRERLITFQDQFKLLRNNLAVQNDFQVIIFLSEDRVICVRLQTDNEILCVLDEKNSFGVYFAPTESFGSVSGSKHAKKLVDLVPHNPRRDPLLTIMEVLAVWATFGSFRPHDQSLVNRFLTTRQVKELMQLYLSLDANGGHTTSLNTSVEEIWDGESPVIVIKSTAYVALGLIGLLFFALLTIIARCHLLANRFRSKQLRRLDGFFSNKMLALNEVRFDLELEYLLSTFREELGYLSTDAEDDLKSKNVRLQIVDGNSEEQRFEALDNDVSVPRDYKRSLTGYGSRTEF